MRIPNVIGNLDKEIRFVSSRFRRAAPQWLILVIVGMVAVAIMNLNVNAQKKAVKTAAKTTTTATRLTGTYRLNPAIGDNAREVAERATQNLPSSSRQATLDDLLNRLDLADVLAIERRGRTISLISSQAPRVSFAADGITRTETTPEGATARVRASLIGDQLVINYSGIPGNDYTITFDLIDAASRLSVTRRVYATGVNQPVIVQSLYERTSDLARWDIYQPVTTAATQTQTAQTADVDTFIVPDNTTLVTELNDDLSTKESSDRDRFTLTVREPSKFTGATIEGYVSNVKRSGKITGRSEMTFNFDRIRLANGRSYKFSGIVESLRGTSGEVVKVDNEGAVKEGESRTSTTGKRAVVGTAVGAIIGAIAGGGKGAAIGAIVGAGAGAGSVYIQGRDDLELKRGTEVTVRATAPKS